MILYGVAFKYLRALKIIMRIYLLFGFPSTYKRVTKKKKMKEICIMVDPQTPVGTRKPIYGDRESGIGTHVC